MPPIPQDSMTPSSRIILHLPFLPLIFSQSSKTPSEKGCRASASAVAIPTVATATSLLSSWIGPLIAQFKTGSNDSQYLFFLADLREFSTSGVLHHWLLLQYLYLLLLCHPFLVHINLCWSSTRSWIAGWTSCWFMRLWRHCWSLVNHMQACQ